MKLGAWAVVAVTSLGLLGAAAQQDPYERMDEFRDRAKQEREKLGLDRKGAKEQYPTPELNLVGGKREVSPGETVELRATGRLLDGSLVVFSCPEFEVLSLDQRADGVTARVKVPRHQLPRSCELIAVSPVSGIGKHLSVLTVGGEYEWNLKVSNGMSMKGTTRTGEEGFDGEAEWFDKGKSLGERPIHIRGSGDRWSAEVEKSLEERQAESDRTSQGMAQSDQREVMKKLKAITTEMQKECAQVAQAQMAACYQRYQKQMQEASAPMHAVANQAKADASVHPNACLKLDLEVKAGKVTGTAEGCRTDKELRVTGTVAAARR